MKIRHAKIKNTGILFELLARQIAEDTLNNVNSKAIAIVKEHFKKGTELNKELGLYQSLLNQRYNNNSSSNQFVDAVLEERKKINASTLRKQKYNLVKALKENYVVEDFINGRINNYKVLASTYKLFESCTTDVIVNPAEKVESRNTLIEHIGSKNTQKKVIQEMEEFKHQDKDLRLLTQKLLFDKFNEKYNLVLNESQKSLLREYILSVSNTPSLKEYVDKELASIKKNMKKYIKNIEDKVIQIKINEIVNQMGDIEKSNVVKDEHLVRMMRYYQLVDELKNVKK